MTRPRSSLVSVRGTPHYHCSRHCVRRAFLCGHDPVSGKSFDHRNQLILERLAVLTEVFAIDLYLRLANKEDCCTGRFCAGRYKSQALLDEEALLTVMAYVVLNALRAGLADRSRGPGSDLHSSTCRSSTRLRPKPPPPAGPPWK